MLPSLKDKIEVTKKNNAKGMEPVLVELSPAAYLALCGLVRDALLTPSDATGLLNRVAQELAGAMAGGMIPSELVEQPECLESLRRAGFAGH